MAKQASEFPGRPSYNWAPWLNGKIWELEKGIDFTGKVASARSAVVAYAKRHGIKVRTVTKQNGNLVIQAIRDAEVSE